MDLNDSIFVSVYPGIDGLAVYEKNYEINTYNTMGWQYAGRTMKHEFSCTVYATTSLSTTWPSFTTIPLFDVANT